MRTAPWLVTATVFTEPMPTAKSALRGWNPARAWSSPRPRPRRVSSLIHSRRQYRSKRAAPSVSRSKISPAANLSSRNGTARPMTLCPAQSSGWPQQQAVRWDWTAWPAPPPSRRTGYSPPTAMVRFVFPTLRQGPMYWLKPRPRLAMSWTAPAPMWSSVPMGTRRR